MLVILVEHVAILRGFEKVSRSFAIVPLAERWLLADLVPKAVLFEVLLIEVLHVRLVHLVLAQVIEDLLASIEIGLHSVIDVLDQVRQSVALICLVVQIFHSLARS